MTLLTAESFRKYNELHLLQSLILAGKYRLAQKERMSLGSHAHQIYLPAISFFGVISNQKSTFENLLQSTI